MSIMLENWVKSLKLTSKSRLVYHTDDFVIKIHPYKSDSLANMEKRIRVYDIEGNRLDNYTWHIFNDIADRDIVDSFEKDLEDGLDNDRYLCFLLSRIVADFPSFFKRKEELEYFKICQKKGFLAPLVSTFSVQDCEVFLYTSVSEERFYRYRRDDRFEITRINCWHIKYQKAIIMHPYLQSLLPGDSKIIDDEYAYSSTFIGEGIKSFVKDDAQTKNLHEKFSMDDFIISNGE